MGKLDELIQAIAESGNEKVMSAFLEWQDEGIKAKERLIEKLDKLLKTSEGKPETTSENSLHKHFVTASILKDKDSFENDMAAATLNVMLKHNVVTGYKGDFGRWINCKTKFRYLNNAGGIYVENLDFAATESDYHR